MRTKLFNALEAFKIPGRGTVICANFEDARDRFWIGDTIEILFSSGASLRTKIVGCDVFRGTFERKVGGILVTEELAVEEVVNAEIFKVAAADVQAPNQRPAPTSRLAPDRGTS